ncbi:MAG: Uma2 family endonuclease [Chloroflexota bacterium]
MTTLETQVIPPPAAAWDVAPANGRLRWRDWPVIAIDLPVLYEDEGLEEMGDHSRHTKTINFLYNGLRSHLARLFNHHVHANLNVHYHPLDKKAYVSPDILVIVAALPPDAELGAYRVGEDGPAPVLVIEVLSERTYQQQDLSPTGKPVIYGRMGVQEYILVDVSGEFLPERLLLKRLRPGQQDAHDRPVWQDEQDEDGGVTSQLGFRLIIEWDDQVRVLDAATGRRYLRPTEAEAALQEAERRAAELAARLAALEKT